MTMDSTKSEIGSSEGGHFLFDDWFDPLENGVRTRIRGFIEELLEAELDAALGRDLYERPRRGGGNSPIGAVGSRHGHRERGLMGTFGATTIRVPRARLTTPEGKTAERRNATIPAYQRRTKRADALIAGAYLSGTNTRRVRRALAALFGPAECAQQPERPAALAHLCSETSVCERHYNTACKRGEHGAGVVRRRRRHDQGHLEK
jgi:hypothetical protein